MTTTFNNSNAQVADQPALDAAGTGGQFQTVIEAAEFYATKLNWCVHPLRPHGKEPIVDGWNSKLTAMQWNEKQGMFRPHHNIGMTTGRASGGVVGFDMDWPEAKQIAARILPGFWALGRKAKLPGMYLCKSDDAKVFKANLTPDDAAMLGIVTKDDHARMVCELLVNLNVMLPPSVHENGDQVEWSYKDGQVPVVNGESARRRLGLIAFLSVVLRKYPRTSGDRDMICLALAGSLLNAGYDAETTDRLVKIVAELAGDEEWDKRNKGQQTATKQESGQETTGLPRLCDLLGIDGLHKKLANWLGACKRKIDKDKPNVRDIARAMVKDHTEPIIHLNDEFHYWRNGAYNPRETDTVRKDAYDFLEKINAKPTPTYVTATLDALTSLIHLERFDFKPPCWINDSSGSDPREILVCRNGLLHLPTGELRPHTPDYLTHNALDYDFDPTAPEPVDWLKFLSEIWPGKESDCITALQQWFGYLLTPDTGQQKILNIIGPRRSGKGTVNRVLTGVLGQHNICSPKLRQFGETFGLQPLIGKQVAIISDMRLGSADKSAVAEALLTISGEDYMTIPRKHLAAWEGYLRARFVLMGNEPLAITDPSGALPGRLIVLQMRQSFYGREDHTLTERLLQQRTGILNWSIAGWRALQATRLQQPASSNDAVRLINRLSSIVGSFLEDECALGGECWCWKDDLYLAFNNWTATEGIEFHLSKEVFCKELYAATSGKVRDERGTNGTGKRAWKLRGVKWLAGLERKELLEQERQPNLPLEKIQ